MAYGRVITTIWSDPEFRSLSDDGRLVELYLRTAPHRNRLGLFVLDELYAAADLGWEVGRVKVVLKELESAGRINWDWSARVVFVRDTWEVEALENPNVVKGALRELKTVPRTVLLTVLLKAVQDNYRDHYSPLVKRLKQLTALTVERLTGLGVTNDLDNDSGNGLVTPTLPDPTKPNPTSPLLTDVVIPVGLRASGEEKKAWAGLRKVVLEEWHQGEEVIELSGGAKVGMWAEHQKFLQLSRTYGLEEAVGAIRTAPGVFESNEPMSLNWFTSDEVGPANFNVACGAYFKSTDI
jgi:hypothetical protein